jgi:hypothetical protein
MRRDFHGIVIEDGAGSLPHPLAAFFAHFPAAAPYARVDLTFRLRRQRFLPRHDLRVPIFFHGVVQVSASAGGFLAEAPSLQVLLSRDARTLELIERGDTEPPYAAGILHVMLLFALRFFGLYDLHAGGSALRPSPDAEAIPLLVVGGSGAGKTTTTLALAERAPLLGDDRILVRETDPLGMLAYPRALHLGDITRDLFPDLESRVVKGEPKREAEIPEGRLALSLGPIGAVVLPHITSLPHTQIRPAVQADTYGALLEASAIAFVQGVPGRDANRSCLSAIADIPAFHLDLGHDARNSARRVRDVLAEALSSLPTKATPTAPAAPT